MRLKDSLLKVPAENLIRSSGDAETLTCAKDPLFGEHPAAGLQRA